VSVYHQTILILGWSIGTDTYKEFDPEPEEDEWENKLEQEYSFRDADKGDIAVIYDGMGGQYCYFGKVMALTNSTRKGPQSFTNRIQIEPVQSGTVERLRDEAEEAGLDVSWEPKYHVFTHVT